MNVSHVWKVTLVFSLTINNFIFAIDVIRGITPWLVSIQKNNLQSQSILHVYEHHCAGILTEPHIVLTTAHCVESFPEDYAIVIFAGSHYSKNVNWDQSSVQKLLPLGLESMENTDNNIVSIFIAPFMQRTKYVDFIAKCKMHNCMLNTFGYQYGYRYNKIQINKFDFSNSSVMCTELNENLENKYCAYHNCTTGEKNIGGEALTKMYKGQTHLMGFWDYDACDKNIRVFVRLRRGIQNGRDINSET